MAIIKSLGIITGAVADLLKIPSTVKVGWCWPPEMVLLLWRVQTFKNCSRMQFGTGRPSLPTENDKHNCLIFANFLATITLYKCKLH